MVKFLKEKVIAMDELKRCPFCGELPRTEVRVTKMGGTEDQVDFSIYCPKCGVSKYIRLRIAGCADFIDVNKAESDVIAAWNQRIEEEKNEAK